MLQSQPQNTKQAEESPAKAATNTAITNVFFATKGSSFETPRTSSTPPFTRYYIVVKKKKAEKNASWQPPTECSDWAWNTCVVVTILTAASCPAKLWLDLGISMTFFPTKGTKIVSTSFPTLKSHTNASSCGISFTSGTLAARLGNAIFSSTTLQYRNAHEKEVGMDVNCQLSISPSSWDIFFIFICSFDWQCCYTKIKMRKITI